MNRSIINKLIAWKNSPKRKPLILMGARQVGKTYSLKAFGEQEYKNYLYLNFEDTPALCKLFLQDLSPKRIISSIELELKIKIRPGESLIIFDEVQECPQALNSLKYFCEQASEHHVCAAGSLLGVKLINKKGFPVGKVDILTLYPLTFDEFLWALHEESLQTFLSTLCEATPLPELQHQRCLEYFKLYLYIGGMPEAVASYIETNDLDRVRQVQDSILKAYHLDFAKHAPPNQIMKINQVWQSIPNQLAKENKKFVYSVIRKGARAKEFETAIQWLYEAGLILKAYNISAPRFPIDAYANFNYFKLYFLDVGLLGATSKLPANIILYGHNLFQEYKGSLTENVIAQMLSLHEQKLYYWTSEGTAEIDFVLQTNNDIVPIEVKSGSSNKMKSLKIYIDKYQPRISIRTSTRNLAQETNLFNIPLYLMTDVKKLLAFI